MALTAALPNKSAFPGSKAAFGPLSWDEVAARLPELDDHGLANALAVFGIAPQSSARDNPSELEAEGEEVRALVAEVRDLMRRHAEASEERESEAGHARRLQEAADREASRTQVVRTDVEAAKERLAAARLALDEAQLLDGEGAEAVTDVELGSWCLEVAQAERAALFAEALKARGVRAALDADSARWRADLAEGQPRFDKLRRALTERYVENDELRHEIGRLKADLIDPQAVVRAMVGSPVELVEDLSFEDPETGGDAEPILVLRIHA